MSVLDPQDALAAVERQNDVTQTKQAELPVTKVFDVDVTDGRGRQYTGRFVYKVPTVGDQIKIGQVKALYLPGGTPDMASQSLVDMLAYLNVTCSFSKEHPKPAWFDKALQLYDAVALDDVYRRALSYERRFLSGDSVSLEDEGTAPGEEKSSGTDQPHVGRKVQPPAERRETLAGDPS